MNVLVLCTGNICRSPIAEALIVREAAALDAEVAVGSAGFVTEGRAAEPHARRVMADRGLDLDAHRSRFVTPEMLTGADLVIGMTREHVRRAVTTERNAFSRSFALKELVRRGTAVGPVVDDDLAGWLELIDAEREPVDLLGRSDEDDVSDPMGRSLRRFKACAAEIEEHVTRLADLLWPPPAPDPGAVSRSA